MEDCKTKTTQLTNMGFNGNVLNIKPPLIKEKYLLEGEDLLVKSLDKNNETTDDMFKIGDIGVNSRVVLKEVKRLDK